VARERDRLIAEIARDEADERFTAAGIELVYGDASFGVPDELAVGGRRLPRAALRDRHREPAGRTATGGIETVPYLTYRSIFDLQGLPAQLLVLGAGPIGLELAQAFRRLGSAVTVVEQLDRLLPGDEPEPGALAAEVLRSEGIELLLSTEAKTVRNEGAEVVLETDGGAVRAEAFLVTRRPSLHCRRARP